MSVRESVEIVLEAFEAVEQRDDQRSLGLYDPEVEFHWPASLPFGGSSRGGARDRPRPSWSEVWEPLQPTVAERRMDPRVVAATDREVVVLWRQRGLSPSGERFDGEVLGMYEVRDRKLARAQMFYFDTAAVQRFLDCAADPGAGSRAQVAAEAPPCLTKRMKVSNRHARVLGATPEQLAALVADFELVWPTQITPAPRPRGPRLFEAGVMLCEEVDRPNAIRAFRVVSPNELQAEHWFETEPADGGTLLRHVIEGYALGEYEEIWREQMKPQHDYVIEALFDKVEAIIQRA